MLHFQSLSSLFPYTTLFRSCHVPTLTWGGIATRRRRFPDHLQFKRSESIMKIRNSLKSLKDRHRDNRVIRRRGRDRKSTRLNSSHVRISYAVFCLKKKIDSIVGIPVMPVVYLAAPPRTRSSEMYFVTSFLTAGLLFHLAASIAIDPMRC